MISIQSQAAATDAARLANDLRRAINGLAGVSYTGQAASRGTPGETLVVGLPASNVPAMMNMVKWHTDQAEAGPVTVEIATSGLRASFEPHALTQDQLKRLAVALSGP